MEAFDRRPPRSFATIDMAASFFDQLKYRLSILQLRNGSGFEREAKDAKDPGSRVCAWSPERAWSRRPTTPARRANSPLFSRDASKSSPLRPWVWPSPTSPKQHLPGMPSSRRGQRPTVRDLSPSPTTRDYAWPLSRARPASTRPVGRGPIGISPAPCRLSSNAWTSATTKISRRLSSAPWR